MSDDYKIQVNLKRNNDLLNVRANTVTELAALIDEARRRPELAAFFEVAVPKASPYSREHAGSSAGTGPVAPATSEAATVPSDAEALAAIERNLGPGTEKAASKSQILVAAKKSGQSAESLAGISEARAKALIAGGE